MCILHMKNRQWQEPYGLEISFIFVTYFSSDVLEETKKKKKGKTDFNYPSNHGKFTIHLFFF